MANLRSKSFYRVIRRMQSEKSIFLGFRQSEKKSNPQSQSHPYYYNICNNNNNTTGIIIIIKLATIQCIIMR